MITNRMIERYELFLNLKKEMDKTYRYKWPVSMWNGNIEWRESTDTLSDIIYKQKEGWIEKAKLIEEVI